MFVRYFHLTELPVMLLISIFLKKFLMFEIGFLCSTDN